MFDIQTDPARGLVHARMAGFLSPDDVRAFSAAEQRAVAAMGLGDGEFLLLIDTTDCLAQSQEAVAAFMDIVVHSRRRARRIAVVRSNSLSRMQTQRILSVRGDARVFAATQDATAWLFDDRSPS